MSSPVFREATSDDAAPWQALLERLPSGDLLHDWEWAAVAAFDGTPQRSFVLDEGGDLTAICATQVRRTALGRSFWYVPRGPVLDYDHPDAAYRLRAILAGLHDAARADKAIAVRLEPRVEAGSPAAAFFDASDLRRVSATLQTPDTRLVDLVRDDEALLATFDKDTRYSIRRSEREGVTTTVIDDPPDDASLVALHALVTQTLQRARYKLPPLERYRIIWRGLAGAGRARIIQAHHDGNLESTALLVVEGDRSFYLYAGSIREAPGETKRFPAYAVQWQLMRTAREMGARTHDLWGVAPEDAGPDHPWWGYSLFKKGFDGRFVSWAGSWDLVINPLLYRMRDLASTLRGRSLGRGHGIRSLSEEKRGNDDRSHDAPSPQEPRQHPASRSIRDIGEHVGLRRLSLLHLDFGMPLQLLAGKRAATKAAAQIWHRSPPLRSRTLRERRSHV